MEVVKTLKVDLRHVTAPHLQQQATYYRIDSVPTEHLTGASCPSESRRFIARCSYPLFIFHSSVTALFDGVSGSLSILCETCYYLPAAVITSAACDALLHVKWTCHLQFLCFLKQSVIFPSLHLPVLHLQHPLKWNFLGRTTTA